MPSLTDSGTEFGRDALLGEERDESRHDGDTRRRSLLADRAFGHVQVDGALLEQVLVLVVRQAEFESVRAQEGEGDLCRLLDDVAELAGELDPRSGHGSDFDGHPAPEPFPR